MTASHSISEPRRTVRPRRIGAVWRRVAHILPMVLGVILINFFLLQLVPGDAAEALAGEMGAASAETMAVFREHMGLNAPLWRRLLDYLAGLARLDLGFSYRYNMPVLDLILSRLPATLSLAGAAWLLGLVLGVAAGAVMATWRNRWPDRVLNTVVLLLYSVPAFGFGLLLIVVFSVQLGWAPSAGAGTAAAHYSGVALVLDRLAHLALPALALSSNFIAMYARLTRSSMIEASRQDYVRTAHAKGVHPFVIAVRHVLRNALIPVTTMAGLHLGGLIGGAATVEIVFGWPGIGRLALDSVQSRDFPTLLGILLLTSFVIILSNVLIDALHGRIDPRIRVRQSRAAGGEA